LNEIGTDLEAATPGISEGAGQIQTFVQAEIAIGAAIHRTFEGVGACKNRKAA